MSAVNAETALQAAVVAALRAVLGADVSGVFDGVPAGAAYPYVSIEDGQVADWSFKGLAGREHRLALLVRDDGASAARLNGLMARTEAAVAGLAPVLDGHRIAGLALLRTKVVRPAGGAWAGLVEFRVRTVAGS